MSEFKVDISAKVQADTGREAADIAAMARQAGAEAQTPEQVKRGSLSNVLIRLDRTLSDLSKTNLRLEKTLDKLSGSVAGLRGGGGGGMPMPSPGGGGPPPTAGFGRTMAGVMGLAGGALFAAGAYVTKKVFDVGRAYNQAALQQLGTEGLVGFQYGGVGRFRAAEIGALKKEFAMAGGREEAPELATYTTIKRRVAARAPTEENIREREAELWHEAYLGSPTRGPERFFKKSPAGKREAKRIKLTLDRWIKDQTKPERIEEDISVDLKASMLYAQKYGLGAAETGKMLGTISATGGDFESIIKATMYRQGGQERDLGRMQFLAVNTVVDNLAEAVKEGVDASKMGEGIAKDITRFSAALGGNVYAGRTLAVGGLEMQQRAAGMEAGGLGEYVMRRAAMRAIVQPSKTDPGRQERIINFLSEGGWITEAEARDPNRISMQKRFMLSDVLNSSKNADVRKAAQDTMREMTDRGTLSQSYLFFREAFSTHAAAKNPELFRAWFEGGAELPETEREAIEAVRPQGGQATAVQALQNRTERVVLQMSSAGRAVQNFQTQMTASAEALVPLAERIANQVDSGVQVFTGALFDLSVKIREAAADEGREKTGKSKERKK